MMLRHLLMLALALYAGVSMAAPPAYFNFNNAGTLTQSTAINVSPAVVPIVAVPVTTMRPGKLYVRNDLFGTRTVGEPGAVFNDNDAFGPNGWPGATGGSPWWSVGNLFWTGPGSGSGFAWSGAGADPSGGHGAHGRNAGDFRTFCPFSHFAYDDPLVYPGQPGRSHLHAFFGNTETGGNTTSYDIANKGNSTCSGGAGVNRTGYWVPAIIYHCPAPPNDTGCDRGLDGTPIRPYQNNVYYKGSLGSGSILFDANPLNYWGQLNDIVIPPPGFRMIAGSATASPTSPNASAGFSQAGCRIGDLDGSLGGPVTANGPWPGTGVGVHQASGGCSNSATDFTMVITFPACWDGVNLDSPGHNAHVGGGIGDNRIDCTTSFQPGAVQIPGITYNLRYAFDGTPGYRPADAKWYRLVSDNYDDTYPAGYSGHADWMNGWNQAELQAIIDFCLKPGLDCHNDVVGIGTGATYDGNGVPSSWKSLQNFTTNRNMMARQKPYTK